MQSRSFFLVLLAAVLQSDSAATLLRSRGSRTITQVVKLLEDMLEKSKEDGDADRKAYAKFACYCRTNEESKTSEIKDLTRKIKLHEGKIQELTGGTGELSIEVNKLKSDMDANELARNTAKDDRNKENAEFRKTRTDLTMSIGQMNRAIKQLAEVGADQELENSKAATSQFMAGYSGSSMLAMKTEVQKALSLATLLLGPEKAKPALALLQKPFTGTYTAQSGEVVGLLKNMRDTFEANLESAEATEKTKAEAYTKFMAVKEASYQDLKDLYDEKQGVMGSNDGDLSSNREQLDEATEAKEEAEGFLEDMRPKCERKAEEFKARNLLRSNEDAAIAVTIGILNKDDAFQAFGKTKATMTGPSGPVAPPEFVQLSAVRRAAEPESERASAQQMLQAAFRSTGSLGLLRIAASLQAGNPFADVLVEIEKMQQLIRDEEKADYDKFDWCAEEQRVNREKRDKKGEDIIALEQRISGLKTAIEDPDVGLQAQIAAGEQQLQNLMEDKTKQTKMRKQENQAYQQNIADLQQTETVLKSATAVLKKYYSQLEASLMQQEDNEEPKTWDKTYKGQSDQGNKAINMLEFIMQENTKEENTAHDDERRAQHDFEDNIKLLEDEEKLTQEKVGKLTKTLMSKKTDLLEAQKMLKQTEADKSAVEAYLEDIKPDCDFIQKNINARDSAREKESGGLTHATNMIKGSPPYKQAVAAADIKAMGDCREYCEVDRKVAECQACLSDVSVPGYCAGHPGTPGC